MERWMEEGWPLKMSEPQRFIQEKLLFGAKQKTKADWLNVGAPIKMQ